MRQPDPSRGTFLDEATRVLILIVAEHYVKRRVRVYEHANGTLSEHSTARGGWRGTMRAAPR